jgi:hypothetical protein
MNKYKSMNSSKLLSIVLLSLLSCNLSAQKIEIAIWGSQGLGYQMHDNNIYEPGFSGAGIRIGRIQSIANSPISINNGIEYSFQGWGSQILFNNGIQYQFWVHGPFTISGSAYFLNGFALFRENTLYAGSIEIGPDVEYKIGERIAFQLSSGIKYTACPGYKKYGPIWSYTDVPIRLGLKLRL